MTEITNEKYILLNESLKAINLGAINIVTLIGSPGMGKTYTTTEYLKKEDINYKYVNTYATPLSFYKLLYENRNKDVIIFDDIHGISNPLVLSMLKAACWISDNERTVSYYSTSDKMDKHGLPESFELTANVVLIFNRKIKDYAPITSRGITIEFKFSFDEKIKLFEEIKENADIDEEILEYVKKNCNESTTNLSTRTLVNLSKIKRGGQDFKVFAKGMLPIDESKKMLLEMTWKEWTTTTGMSRRSYFYHKDRLGLNKKSAKVQECKGGK